MPGAAAPTAVAVQYAAATQNAAAAMAGYSGYTPSPSTSATQQAQNPNSAP